jgi:hypothetical protein
MADQSVSIGIAQLVLTPILATITTLFLQKRQERERLSCFVDWRYKEYDDGIEEYAYIGLHNRSTQSIAVHSVRWVRNGVFARTPVKGTALEFDDPLDLAFPYLIAPGEIRSLRLNEEAAEMHATSANPITRAILILFNVHRILIEVRTTAQTELLVEAEGALPWSDRIRGARF